MGSALRWRSACISLHFWTICRSYNFAAVAVAAVAFAAVAAAAKSAAVFVVAAVAAAVTLIAAQPFLLQVLWLVLNCRRPTPS